MDWKKLLCDRRISGKPNKKVFGDLRSQFERDYDRSIFSTPVRRLQDKAQVFVLETHDAVRTRLFVHTKPVRRLKRRVVRPERPTINVLNVQPHWLKKLLNSVSGALTRRAAAGIPARIFSQSPSHAGCPAVAAGLCRRPPAQHFN